MNIEIVYIYPLDGQNGFIEKAMRFVDSYHRHPPGVAHSTTVVCNGASISGHARYLFSSLLNPSFVQHDNTGQDIGGFLKVARSSDADIMVFFGACAYFRRAAWMGRVRDSFLKHGDTIYGSSGNQGIGNVQPHIRTTGFWMSPALLRQYPKQNVQTHERYEFEHGNSCLTSWIKSRGLQPWVVTWAGEYPLQSCDAAPEGYHHGNQSNLLFGDRLTCPPFHYCS